jgi:hypothetical protein
MDNHRGDRIASPPFPVMFLFFFFSSMKHARAGFEAFRIAAEEN